MSGPSTAAAGGQFGGDTQGDGAHTPTGPLVVQTGQAASWQPDQGERGKGGWRLRAAGHRLPPTARKVGALRATASASTAASASVEARYRRLSAHDLACADLRTRPHSHCQCPAPAAQPRTTASPSARCTLARALCCSNRAAYTDTPKLSAVATPVACCLQGSGRRDRVAELWLLFCLLARGSRDGPVPKTWMRPYPSE